MILIIGTPDSGKSAFAEELAVCLSGGEKMAYVATMIPFDEDGENRIQRHRKLREGKNFITFEEPHHVSKVSESLEKEGIKTVLLECVSNLVGNVIHMLDGEDDYLINEIVNDISVFSSCVENLIVVANYFEQDSKYDSETNRYIHINNLVNERLKHIADMYYVKEDGQWMRKDNRKSVV